MIALQALTYLPFRVMYGVEKKLWEVTPHEVSDLSKTWQTLVCLAGGIGPLASSSHGAGALPGYPNRNSGLCVIGFFIYWIPF